MSDMTMQISGDDQIRVDIANGAIMKAIGLDKHTLRLGLDVARNFMTRGAYREAFQAYVSMVICDPMDLDFQIGLANCALYISENDLALQSASAAIGLAPDDARGYFLSARACLALGAFHEARDDLKEALRLAIENDDAVVLTQATKVMNGLSVLDASTEVEAEAV